VTPELIDTSGGPREVPDSPVSVTDVV